jgi:protein O-GlcNAc transferase
VTVAPQTMTLDQAAALALEHHRAGRPAEALTVYDAVLAVRPDHLNILYMKAQAQMAVGDPAGAVATLDAAAARHPDVAALPALAAECLLAQNLPDAALESCRRALARDGREMRALKVAAAALERLGRLQPAADMLAAALSFDPTLFDLRLRQAGLLRRTGDRVAARAALRALAIIAPDQADAYAHYGLSAIDDGDFAVAARCFERGLRLNPDYVELALQLSDLQRSLCDYDGVDAAAGRLSRLLQAKGGEILWRHLASALYRDLFMPLPAELIRPLQDEIDRQLTAEVAAAPPPTAAPAPPAAVGDGRIHLAFLSANLGNHPIGQVSRSFFARLDRRRFRLSCFSGRDHTDDPSSPYGRDSGDADRRNVSGGGGPADQGSRRRRAGVP